MFANTSFTKSSRSFNRSSSRRRGQALLLAVLIMLFVALLGTAFIAVVAINIGQTSRQEERDKAKVAAQAGLAFANRQLTFSENATNWRPEQEVQDGVIYRPPTSSDLTYWTPFDQAQGWAGNTNTDSTTGQPAGNYVKFPDPRSLNQNLSAPNYMIKVEKVIGNANPALRDPDNQDNDKTNALRVSVIGLSSDDPNSFKKIVAYKAGPAQMAGNNSMITVTNWDFQNGAVPAATASGSGSSSTSMTIANATGNFPAANFYVVIGDPNTSVRYATVSTFSGSTLNFTTNQTWVDGERVEIAAGLGLPKAIDFDNDSSTPAREEINANVTENANPGSIRVSGSAVFFGKVYSNNLRSSAVSSVPGMIQVSGLIERNVTTENLTLGADTAGNTDGASFSRGGATKVLKAGSTLATDSSVSTFPSPASPAAAVWKDTGGTTLSADEKDQIMSDGWNRISGDTTDTTRQTKPFVPPDITASTDGLGRYRQLTKYSTSTDSSNPQGAAYGRGQGIYVNNPQDREKIGVGTGVYREMTQAELVAMWTDTTTGAKYYRKGTPDAANLDTKSLEEQHLRGWIGPDEFRARGTLVQLNNDNTITITRDARDDGATASGGVTPNQGPVASKGWFDASGALLGRDDGNGVVNNGDGGVYSETFSWPNNGVIFAEGNIRIRGQAPTPLRSLTVVSMNNIYIEDSVGAGTKKLMLLARRNVVMNPTRVLRRPDDQTLLAADIPANTAVSSISVYDAQTFQPGDWVFIDTASANDPAFCVASVPNSTTLNLVTPISYSTAKTAGTPVRTQGDPPDSSGLPYNNYANRLSRFNQSLQRRMTLPAGTASVRLALRHSAEYRKAIDIMASGGADPTLGRVLSEATMTNKLGADQYSGDLHTTDKPLKVKFKDSVDTGGATDTFPNPSYAAFFASEAGARNYRIGETTDSDTSSADKDRDDLQEDLTKRHITPDWTYTATVQNSYNANVAPLIIPPAFFLAAVGNRADFYYTSATGPAPTGPGTWPWTQDIKDKTYDVPMATSVYAYMNGTRATIRGDRYDPNLGTNVYEQVKQFGFSTLFGSNAITGYGPSQPEDVITTDQTFYRNGYNAVPGTGVADNTYYTLDSRTLSNAQPGNNTLAFRLNPDAQNYFDATGSNASIPYYRLSRVKLENTNQLNTGNEFETLDPGYTFDVNAYVYAQEGSWFVIPLLFDDFGTSNDVRLNYVNLPSGSPSGTQATNENLDLNRDGGTPSRGEQAAVYRFHRYNYQINFTGAIMENQTALVKNTGSLIGAVSLWTDDWATAHIDSADFASSPSGAFVNGNMVYGTNLNTIKYNFDTTALSGALESDDGWHPPISSEWIYQSG